MKVLVTGGTGFVGGALLGRLVEAGRFQICAAVRGSPRPLSRDIEQVVIRDLGGEADWRHHLMYVDTVVHLAARVHVMGRDTPESVAEFRRVNVAATLMLASQAAAARTKRFVFVSSVKVNGESGCFTEADRPAPHDAYGISKHEAELGLHQIADRSGMELVIIRPPLVYGPGVKANFRTMVRAVARGIPLPLGAVHNRRSLVAVDNLADFIVTCVERPAAANQTFMVSDGEDCSTTDLVRRLARAMGRPARLVPVPAWVLMTGATLIGQRAVARRLLESLQVDISRARRLLGWMPPLSVDEGLRRAVAACR